MMEPDGKINNILGTVYYPGTETRTGYKTGKY